GGTVPEPGPCWWCCLRGRVQPITGPKPPPTPCRGVPPAAPPAPGGRPDICASVTAGGRGARPGRCGPWRHQRGAAQAPCTAVLGAWPDPARPPAGWRPRPTRRICPSVALSACAFAIALVVQVGPRQAPWPGTPPGVRATAPSPAPENRIVDKTGRCACLCR